GGHEAWGAIRGAELGDGTAECAGLRDTLRVLATLLEEDDLLSLFCDHILRLHTQGVYNGAYRAVEAALEGGGQA
ncbi:MAG TPA: hypothetical protein PKI11_18855, partial [Candidatus Hydrogenedentes bacterium]|nr:hypothetical protein [Candidatus Hydrogenedentota bacterium]